MQELELILQINGFGL